MSRYIKTLVQIEKFVTNADSNKPPSVGKIIHRVTEENTEKPQRRTEFSVVNLCCPKPTMCKF